MVKRFRTTTVHTQHIKACEGLAFKGHEAIMKNSTSIFSSFVTTTKAMRGNSIFYLSYCKREGDLLVANCLLVCYEWEVVHMCYCQLSAPPRRAQ